ncbi:MAG: hypothetical protein V1918_10600 [Planctomycetota bacterium]
MQSRILLLTGWMLLFGAAFGAEPADRGGTVDIQQLLRSPYGFDRIQGIRKASELNDKAVVQEFKIVEQLLKIAQDEMGAPIERTEALRALVVLTNRKMIDPIETLGRLEGIINNPRTNLEVRIEALNLLSRFGRVQGATLDEQDLVRRVNRRVLEIAQGNAPVPLRCSAFRVLGILALPGSDRLLYRIAANDPNPNARRAAMEGLTLFLETTASTSPQLLTEFRRMAEKANAPADRDIRVACLQAIEQLLSNGADSRGTDTTEYLLGVMTTGSEPEVIAASRALLRITDPRVVQVHLDLLARGLKNPVLEEVLIKGVIELMPRLAAVASFPQSSSAEKDAAVRNANRIVNEFLGPVILLPQAPLSLRRIAAMGLGAVPVAFDRTRAVTALIAALRTSPPRELANEIESYLLRISMLPRPYRTPDGGIDASAWEQWLQRNSGRLVPGRAPWDEGF